MRAPGIVYTTRNDFAAAEPSGLTAPRRISTAGGAGSFSPEMEFDGRVKESCTPSPACCAARSLIATGTGGEGGTGSPGAPQPAENRKMEKRKWKMGRNCGGRFSMQILVPFLFSIFKF